VGFFSLTASCDGTYDFCQTGKRWKKSKKNFNRRMHMEDRTSGGPTNEQLFVHLVMMFQVAAMQQLGKVMNPVTNKIERDLDQAKFSIDTIAMLKEKTKGNLSPSEEEYLGKVLFELQMNYVDEVDRAKKEDKASADEKTAGEGEDKQTEPEPSPEKSEAEEAAGESSAEKPPPEEKTGGEKPAAKQGGNQKASAGKKKGAKSSSKGKKKPKSG
jgi:hypothetical protein